MSHTATVTSPRTGTTFVATVTVADIYARTFTMLLEIRKPGRRPAVATARVAADDTVTISGTPWRHTTLAGGHCDSVDLLADEVAEVLAGARYMWARMRAEALVRRVAGMQRKAAEFLADGESDKAARIMAALAA